MSLPFRKLALGAGGVKGILHIGALQELSKFQKLEFPDGIYGCSVGAVIGTCLSFGIPPDEELAKTYLSMDKITKKPTFNDIRNAFSAKGLYDMDEFEKTIVELFEQDGIDIRNKKIGDAEQPLYIVASNLTKGVPTVFSKDVPLLDALKCSCCIPGIFKPQELYGQIYIDGGLFTPSLTTLAPDALHLSLTKQSKTRITPKTIETISPVQFMKDVYSMATHNFIVHQKTDLTVDLEYPELHSDSELRDFDVSNIIEHSKGLMRRFLSSKGFGEERSEV